MNKRLLDILVCPFDKVSSLDLLEFEIGPYSPDPGSNNIDLEDKKREPTQTSAGEGVNRSSIVKEGLLFCKTCNRFYPITEEIPIILPDELRDKKKDLDFLNKWKKSIPKDLLDNLRPWSI
ncbi:MAG TPA: Trm112 family protein [Candidatus Nitrosocosmicus sp.]|nr:Trm112 family protein [Candidatus Nitrosocosmicus sp.]